MNSHMESLEEDVQQQRLTSPSPNADALLSSIASLRSDFSSSARWKNSRWRHPLGIFFLLVTVFLWTASNFLASTIFADNTYDKPYFVTYVNSIFFVFPFIPTILRRLKDDPEEVMDLFHSIKRRLARYSLQNDDDSHKPLSYQGSPPAGPVYLSSNDDQIFESTQSLSRQPKLNLKETAKLSLEFCTVWFFANYFAAACLEYTTVGSATILNSTSSIWTLIAGSIVGVERFSCRKLLCVLASLAGVALISGMDVSAPDNTDRGSFPRKTAAELAIGDSLALIAAVAYGMYAVFLKKRIGDESRVDMPLFFGMVGVANTLLAWPGLVLLHILGVETFALPPTTRVLTIVLVNSTASLVSDFCWAYAMLLTSPLVVTVGLSLTIPLSLVGQMVLDGVYSGIVYWFGACVVVASFVFINHEESKDERDKMILEEEQAWESGILRRENLDH